MAKYKFKKEWYDKEVKEVDPLYSYNKTKYISVYLNGKKEYYCGQNLDLSSDIDDLCVLDPDTAKQVAEKLRAIYGNAQIADYFFTA